VHLGIVALCITLVGCVTAGETVSFRASNPQRQAQRHREEWAATRRLRRLTTALYPFLIGRSGRQQGRPASCRAARSRFVADPLLWRCG
jgi:hypothetical protein